MAKPFDDRFQLPTSPFWFHHDDGRRNCDCRPDRCRGESAGDILVGTAMEGIFAFHHHPQVVVKDEYRIDLPGTVLRGCSAGCACLRILNGFRTAKWSELKPVIAMLRSDASAFAT